MAFEVNVRKQPRAEVDGEEPLLNPGFVSAASAVFG